MALDRQAIEKKDFPISRRGYEPEAVDAHLEAIAGYVERLQDELEIAERAAASAGTAAPAPAAATPAPAPVRSLSATASEQVRLIVDAAESSAADIERIAQEEADRIRADADGEARRVGEDAVARSQDHVGRVGEETSTMLQRMDAMESELGSLLDGLRTGTSRLTADLSLLQGNLGDLYSAAGSGQPPASEHEDMPIPAPAPEPVAEAPLIEEDELVIVQTETVVEAVELPEPEAIEEVAPEAPGSVPPPSSAEPSAAEPSAAEATGRNGDDIEGARLIALNMALNGQSREETDQYLAENFELSDRSSLLDEVYATVEG